jgi:outer membrane protein TolC
LTGRALKASPEIKVLDEAIKLNKTKLWTNYLSANALNPLSLALQVARNIAGGGEVAQAKLTTNQLRATRAALEQTMRERVTQYLTDYEAATRAETNTRAQLEAHEQRLSILLVSYRLGDSTTEAVLPEFAQSESLRAQITSAQAAGNAALVKLREIVAPSRIAEMKR